MNLFCYLAYTKINKYKSDICYYITINGFKNYFDTILV